VHHRLALGANPGLRPSPLVFGPPSQRERWDEHRDQDDPPDHDAAIPRTTMREHLSISRIIEPSPCRGRTETGARREDFVQIGRDVGDGTAM
jgi:hypothetical protein